MTFEEWWQVNFKTMTRFIATIGMLNRCLSELKELALSKELDASDTQTVKHHAEDCIGLGQRVLEILKEKACAHRPDTVEVRDVVGEKQGCDHL